MLTEVLDTDAELMLMLCNKLRVSFNMFAPRTVAWD